MSLIVEATYENGVLRPTVPLSGMAEGQRVIITVEDEAEINKREAEFLRKIKEDGLVVHFPPPDAAPPANFTPIEITGTRLSETIIEERR
jgi:predicted DNA-binding antitoxin AbrB/MazE fold protein